MNIDFKTDIVVKESIQNRLKSMLFWETPYMGPAHNRNYNNEHPKIINSLYVRLKPELKPTQCSTQNQHAQQRDVDDEKEHMDEKESFGR